MRRYEIMHVHQEDAFAKADAAARAMAGECAVIVLPEYHLATALPFETLRRAVMSVNWILYVRPAFDGPDTRERKRDET